MTTLRNIMDENILTYVTVDPELNDAAIRLYFHAYFHPLATLSEHSRQLKISYETARRALSRLLARGWVYRASRADGGRGALIVPWLPRRREDAVVAALAHTRTLIHYYGEWLMKCVLDLMLNDRVHHDNARPQWLLYPPTGRRLELDRWYPNLGLAFEFQGPQHFGPDGRLIQSEDEYYERAARDQFKRDTCARRQITLIEISPSDVNFESIAAKLAAAECPAPLVPLRQESPLVREVDGMGQIYAGRSSA